MQLGLEIVLTLAAAILAVPSSFLALQCGIATLFGRGERDKAKPATCATRDEERRTVILIPAHDEATGIGSTLANVIPLLAEARDAVVVADNCTDATASVARSFGATVVERFDAERRGKGYALDFGVRSLEPDPPGVVIVLDADCRLSPGAVDALRERVLATGSPAQGLVLSDGTIAANPTQAVAQFANRIVNLVRPAACEALGMPCRLLGTGMAFPWETLRDAPLANGNLVEDLQLGVDLVVAGSRPSFLPTARVTTELPGSLSSFRSQRTRWEHGQLSAAVHQVPRLIGEAIRRRRPELIWNALDLAVPPLALLFVVSAAAWIVLTASVLLAGVGLVAWTILTLAGLSAACGLLGGWARFCRREIPLSTFALAPGYVLAKAPIYAALLFHRQATWIRTERGGA